MSEITREDYLGRRWRFFAGRSNHTVELKEDPSGPEIHLHLDDDPDPYDTLLYHESNRTLRSAKRCVSLWPMPNGAWRLFASWHYDPDEVRVLPVENDDRGAWGADIDG